MITTYKRGIDSFIPGQLINIRFPQLLDENFYPEASKSNTKKRMKDIKKASILPAVILEKIEDSGDVSYNVGFISRHKSGEMSGLIILKEISIWRYLAKKDTEPEEGTPPNWLLENIKKFNLRNEEYFEGISNSQICYVIEENNIPFLKTVI